MRQPFDRFFWGNGFGPRRSPVTGASTLHLAQDYGVARGTPVLAPSAGVVTASYRTAPGGWWTFLALDNGAAVGICHSDSRSPFVGQRRAEGQPFAYSGNSGTATTGPHAHVTVKVAGVYIDPRAYFSSTAPAGTNPQEIEDNDMYTDADRARDNKTHSIVVNIEDILATEPNAGTTRGIKGALEQLPDDVRAAVWNQSIKRATGPVSALQELANIRTEQLKSST